VTSSPGGITGTGSGSPITVSGLTNGTSYTFTVVATNAIGNSSPSTASSAVTPSAPFSCGIITVADIDGNSYNVVQIGTQCWTGENLRVRRYNDGTAILFDASGGSVGTSSTWQNLAGAHTIYANDSVASPSYLTTYGYLYNWYAAKGVSTSGSTTYKNICPTGWHVPDDGEWTALETQLGGNTVAGGKMKSTGTTLWASPNTGADDSSGFSAHPGGYRSIDGDFALRGFNTIFWSTTSISGSIGGYRGLNRDNGISTTGFFPRHDKRSGASIRCLKD
jgi:uncharacterized protein (TIGR02145 family)